MDKKRKFNIIRARVMRVFFFLLYHQFARLYDIVAAIVSIGKWKQWIFATLPYIKGPCVLELGHGPGHLQEALQSVGIEVFGIDESHNMGRIAIRRLYQRHKGPRLVRGYAQWLPVKSGIFHQVVATFPSEFIMDSTTLSEVYRVLVSDGQLVLLPFARITGSNLLDRLASWLFKVTGQSPKWNDHMLIPYHMAGFDTKLEYVSSKSWSVPIITAIKI